MISVSDLDFSDGWWGPRRPRKRTRGIHSGSTKNIARHWLPSPAPTNTGHPIQTTYGTATVHLVTIGTHVCGRGSEVYREILNKRKLFLAFDVFFLMPYSGLKTVFPPMTPWPTQRLRVKTLWGLRKNDLTCYPFFLFLFSPAFRRLYLLTHSSGWKSDDKLVTKSHARNI